MGIWNQQVFERENLLGEEGHNELKQQTRATRAVTEKTDGTAFCIWRCGAISFGARATSFTRVWAQNGPSHGELAQYGKAKKLKDIGSNMTRYFDNIFSDLDGWEYNKRASLVGGWIIKYQRDENDIKMNFEG